MSTQFIFGLSYRESVVLLNMIGHDLTIDYDKYKSSAIRQFIKTIDIGIADKVIMNIHDMAKDLQEELIELEGLIAIPVIFKAHSQRNIMVNRLIDIYERLYIKINRLYLKHWHNERIT